MFAPNSLKQEMLLGSAKTVKKIRQQFSAEIVSTIATTRAIGSSSNATWAVAAIVEIQKLGQLKVSAASTRVSMLRTPLRSLTACQKLFGGLLRLCSPQS